MPRWIDHLHGPRRTQHSHATTQVGKRLRDDTPPKKAHQQQQYRPDPPKAATKNAGTAGGEGKGGGGSGGGAAGGGEGGVDEYDDDEMDELFNQVDLNVRLRESLAIFVKSNHLLQGKNKDHLQTAVTVQVRITT